MDWLQTEMLPWAPFWIKPAEMSCKETDFGIRNCWWNFVQSLDHNMIWTSCRCANEIRNADVVCGKEQNKSIWPSLRHHMVCLIQDWRMQCRKSTQMKKYLDRGENNFNCQKRTGTFQSTSKQNYICDSMNANAKKDLYYERYLKILSKLHEPWDECNYNLPNEFLNFTGCVSL